MHIERFHATKIRNAKGDWAIELETQGYIASVPSGTSTGVHESIAFKQDINSCIKQINKTDVHITVNRFQDLRQLEHIFGDLGGNPVIASQICALRALCKNNIYDHLTPRPRIPRPLGTCISGGAHAHGVRPDFQEFLVVAPFTKTFFESRLANMAVYKRVQELLQQNDPNFSHQTNMEGDWQTSLSNIQALDLLKKATKDISIKLGFEIKIGLDIAASNFFKDGLYHYKNFSEDKKERTLNRDDQLAFIDGLIDTYKLYYVEDPMHEDDFRGFSGLNHHKCLLVGDDLTCTNPVLLARSIKEDSINSIIIKANQIGSIPDMAHTIRLAKRKNIIPIMSHRSGETTDTWLADFAVGFDTPFIKCGIFGPERTSKLDVLQEIERTILKV